MMNIVALRAILIVIIISFDSSQSLLSSLLVVYTRSSSSSGKRCRTCATCAILCGAAWDPEVKHINAEQKIIKEFTCWFIQALGLLKTPIYPISSL